MNCDNGADALRAVVFWAAAQVRSMPFQPFGYSFEIRSALSPSDLKATIQSRRKKWFDPKNGPRGWIFGPIICLWFHAINRYGPMLIGFISSDAEGTRIHGRAGSDLNGLLSMSFVLLFMAMLVFYVLTSQGLPGLKEIALAGGIFFPLAFLVLWGAHKSRHDADPLVRFLQEAASGAKQTPHKNSPQVKISRPLTLEVNGKTQFGPLTADMLQDALQGVGAGDFDFVIMAAAPQNYIQTTANYGRFLVEMRDGDSQHHFQATRRDSPDDRNFTFEEALAAFLAYASGEPPPKFLRWEPMSFPA